MPTFPEPERPEIVALFAALPRLTPHQWATIVLRYLGGQSRAADASDFAAGIVAGSDLHVSADERRARIAAAHEAYDQISVVLEDLPDSVWHDGEEVPLRGLAEIATLHVVQALLVEEEIAIRPQIWSALTHSFVGFIDLGA